MALSKSKKLGAEQRLEVLSKYEPRSQELLATFEREQFRKHVKPDDVLDALVGYVTAREGNANQRLKGQPERDQLGLPMEMIYPQGRSL